IAIGFIASGFHDPVDDVDAVAGIMEPALAIEEAAGGDAGDVAFLVYGRLELGGGDANDLVIFFHGDVSRQSSGGERESECEERDGSYLIHVKSFVKSDNIGKVGKHGSVCATTFCD